MEPAPDVPAEARLNRRVFLAISMVFAIATFLTRGAQSLAYDELFTVWVASQPWSDLIHQANLDGFTPPLFYGLVKAVSLTGLAREGLRVVPVLFGALALYMGLSASVRLFGHSARWPAVLLMGSSAYLFTFAHELRPYSALLACVFVVAGRLGGPRERSTDLGAGFAALMATAFSYLGMSLVVGWMIECRARVRRLHLASVGCVALLLCAPGLMKAANIGRAAASSSIVWTEAWPAFPEVLLGLASFPFSPWTSAVGLVLLVAVVGLGSRLGDVPAFPFLVRTFLLAAGTLAALQVVVRIGFAPRYFAILVGVLLLMAVGLLSRLGRLGLAAALLIAGINGVAVSRYLTLSPPARQNWREAMARLENHLGPEGILLGFPFHHAAVAAHAYAPSLRMGGGYTSRSGPVFWYEPPAAFAGYSFGGLTRLGEPREALRRLSQSSDLCLLSDEPDATKTMSVFEAFEELGGSRPFDTGDSRLRAICRRKG